MMLASAPGGALHPSVSAALSELQKPESRYDHIVLATAEGSTSRTAPFVLVDAALGGLSALSCKLRTHETRFALLRMQARILLVVSLGQDLGGLRRAQALVQARALQSALGAIVFAALTIASVSQLTSALVGSKLQLEGFPHVASPNIAQDFRSSWSSTSATSPGARAKPSAPSSPEEAALDSSWSRPFSAIGASSRSDALAALASRAHSFHSLVHAPSPERSTTRPGKHGIVIDLEAVIDSSAHEVGTAATDLPPPLPPKADLPPLPTSANDDGPRPLSVSSRPRSAAASLTPAASSLREPIQLRKSSDPDRLSPHIDEFQRQRIDEAIRDEVMRKLHTEQQALLRDNSRSPANRTPRLAISPPLAPPPPFAPPPAPASPLRTAPSTPRLSSKVQRLASTPQRSERNKTSRSGASDRRASAPLLDETAAEEPNANALQASLSETASESHESLRSSMQSLHLWEFAEAASQRTSFLNLPRGRSERPTIGTVSDGKRSRQPSYSDSVASVEPDGQRCAPSSSTGSVAASSIFDKDLPAPPAAAETASIESGEWSGEMDSPDSTHPPSSPWTEPPTGLADKAGRTAGDASEDEVRDLRDRLEQAEARAKAAEEAAEVAVREAQSETRRLAEELAQVERGTRDTMEAEAIRRAKWAREQVAREQLDAYERSKLEADEKRRRRAIEEQRRLDCDRANRIREEREWREHEAERIKHEYEVKIQYLAEREARLKAEAEARADEERSRIEKERKRVIARQERLAEMKRALQGADATNERAGDEDALLSGWLNVQAEGALQWRRRWGKVRRRQLILSKTPTDPVAVATIPLDRARIVSHADDYDDCTMPNIIRLQVPVDQADSTALDTCTHLISTDTLAAKDDIELIIEAIADLHSLAE